MSRTTFSLEEQWGLWAPHKDLGRNSEFSISLWAPHKDLGWNSEFCTSLWVPHKDLIWNFEFSPPPAFGLHAKIWDAILNSLLHLVLVSTQRKIWDEILNSPPAFGLLTKKDLGWNFEFSPPPALTPHKDLGWNFEFSSPSTFGLHAKEDLGWNLEFSESSIYGHLDSSSENPSPDSASSLVEFSSGLWFPLTAPGNSWKTCKWTWGGQFDCFMQNISVSWGHAEGILF